MLLLRGTECLYFPARAEGSCELLFRDRFEGYPSDSVSVGYLLKMIHLIVLPLLPLLEKLLYPSFSFPILTCSKALFLDRRLEQFLP